MSLRDGLGVTKTQLEMSPLEDWSLVGTYFPY